MTLVLDLSQQEWRFRQASTRSPWRKATVPGCVHTDLLRHKLIPDPFFGTNELQLQWIEEADWEYRTLFTVPKTLRGESHLELVADGLDTVATVTLNGSEIARSENMFVGHRWEIGALLRPGRNELTFHFGSARRYVQTHRLDHRPPVEFNDPVGGSTRLRKQACQFGWDWAPRLVTAGIWRGIRLEAWSGARLSNARVRQDHGTSGRVQVFVDPEIQGSGTGLECRAALHLEGKLVAEASGPVGTLALEVADPLLWWPAGQGAQPLYDLSVELHESSTDHAVDRWHRRIGLRSIILDRHPDQWGESFQFVVNGRAVFVKGANWIPVHSFVAALTRRDYERDLRAAVAANMNCVRLWGGGIYESEDFYDLCDELGLLLWHDFMFACTLYPHDDAFAESVAVEVEQQVARIRHHACLMLWCGNNEVHSCNSAALNDPAAREGYEKIFHTLIPDVLARVDDRTPYWPSSEWHGDFNGGLSEGEKRGDTHYWDVWHARKPVSDYERWHLRFCSEFGMQSYASAETMESFSPDSDRNLFGASSENHQKNPFGNQIILDYVTRRYGYPRDQDALIYLSQLNQAYCMEVAVEHYRRNRPRCMGAIYWQLNDCWPAASWSSIEHNGRWKALHYAARRFFAPLIVSARVIGDERQGKGNYRDSTYTGAVELHTVNDTPALVKARLHWELLRLDGRKVVSGSKSVVMEAGSASLQTALDFSRELLRHGRERLMLRHALRVDGRLVSEDTAFFAQPRFVELPQAPVSVDIQKLDALHAKLVVTSAAYQHRLFIDFRGIGHHADDNFIDVHAKEKVEILVTLDRPATAGTLHRALRLQSLATAQ